MLFDDRGLPVLRRNPVPSGAGTLTDRAIVAVRQTPHKSQAISLVSVFTKISKVPKDPPRIESPVNFRGQGGRFSLDVRTTIRKPVPQLGRRRSRFGYDQKFWGEQAAPGGGPSYWALTRGPLPCLAFILPILLAYELGVYWLGGSAAEALRTGADAWVRHGLKAVGLTDRWLLPLGLAIGLLIWQAVKPQAWKFSLSTLLGMGLESLLLAVALVGLSKVLDLGFTALERAGPPVLATSPDPGAGTGVGAPATALVGFLGAGLYEETLFRLLLIPLFFTVLRVLQAPQVLASSMAVTASALLFSLAHHAGTPGEAFTWFAFIFRWLAGVYFAWVFVVRGFGVAVGTHTAYDVLVGWLGWHL